LDGKNYIQLVFVKIDNMNNFKVGDFVIASRVRSDYIDIYLVKIDEITDEMIRGRYKWITSDSLLGLCRKTKAEIFGPGYFMYHTYEFSPVSF
jgi:hypothetical protein